MKEYVMVQAKRTDSWVGKPTSEFINKRAREGWIVTNHQFDYGPNSSFVLMEREIRSEIPAATGGIK